MKLLHVLAVALSMIAVTSAVAAPADPPAASQQLLDHIIKRMENHVLGVPAASSTPGVSITTTSANSALDFWSAHEQLRLLGTKAWPLAPRVASLLQKTGNNQYNLASLLITITPAPDNSDASVAENLNKYRTLTDADRLAQLAKIGKINSPNVIPSLKQAATDDIGIVRLIALISLKTSGSAAPEQAAQILGNALKDKEKYNRTAATNSLQSLGSRAASAAPALIEYLKTRDNVSNTALALKRMPLSSIKAAKPELESILEDKSLNELQKRAVVDLLIRIETEVTTEISGSGT